MATTIVRRYTEPIVLNVEQVRDLAQEWLDSSRGDEDKAGDISDAAYYQGWADAMEGLLLKMIGDATESEPNIRRQRGYRWEGTTAARTSWPGRSARSARAMKVRTTNRTCPSTNARPAGTRVRAPGWH